MRTLYYEEGLDEIALIHNPKGGRPSSIGQLCHKTGAETDIQEIKEEVVFRYHLGYCTCGKKLVIGPRRAQEIARKLNKRGFRGEPVPIRERVRAWLVRRLERKVYCG